MTDQQVSNPVAAVSAPTPPFGPTTYAGLTAFIVGLIMAALSLFDVVPTAEDTQAIGVLVGGAIALGAFVVTAISRTKQATNLAKLAQGERLIARAENPVMKLVAGGSIKAGQPVVVGEQTGAFSRTPPFEPPSVHSAGRRSTDAGPHDTTPRPSLDVRKEERNS